MSLHALIDADMIVYEVAELKDDEGNIRDCQYSIGRTDEKIKSIIEGVGADTYQCYLTGKDNFRVELATIVPYKGTRKKDKPKWYKQVRFHIEKNWQAKVIDGMEADDALSIEQYANIAKEGDPTSTVICSRDKDLDMVPGYHYGWATGVSQEKELWKQDELGGLKCFYKQLITGDNVDNIKGLFGVGAKSAHVTKIDKMEAELEMAQSVYKLYEDRFGRYAPTFYLENGRLLWMKRNRSDVWVPPTGTLPTTLDDWALRPV